MADKNKTDEMEIEITRDLVAVLKALDGALHALLRKFEPDDADSDGTAWPDRLEGN